MMKHHAQLMARLSDLTDGQKNNFKLFTSDFAKIAFCWPVSNRGDCSAPFRQERRNSMNPNHEEHKQHSFDSYCKKVLKRKALDYHREAKRRSEREITFSDMSPQELARLAITDEYFTDEYIFTIHGERVGVLDVDLAEALHTLPADRREIVFMSYFFDMTDKEIANKLNIARRTVAYRRTSSLRELKKFMESEE